MKRTQLKPAASGHRTRTRAIAANRLIDVRGGGGGITIQIVGPTPFEMQMQHNERLVRL